MIKVEIKNLVKSYDGKVILDNVNLKIEKGETVCIFGPSGQGKTTLLNIIAGLVCQDCGTITNNNCNISYVFQEDRLLNWSTARENIMLSARNIEAAEQFIKIAGIEDCLNMYPEQMSGGMKRRTAIARAVAYDGDIFLLDEPFNAIDEKRAKRIAEYMKKLMKDKVCILVTHNLKEAEWFEAKKVNL